MRLYDTPPGAAADALGLAPAIVWKAERGDQGFRARFISAAASAQLGYPCDAWSQAPEFWLRITHPDDREVARRHMADALASPAAGPSIVRWLRADGSPVAMEVHLIPIADPEGAVVGLRGLALEASRWLRMRDELERAQEELACAARRATLNDLVASLVHEINQPLNAILNNAQAARLALGPTPAPVQVHDVARMLDAIVGASERTAAIIRRARGFVRGGAAERKSVDLNAVVAEACDLLASDAVLRNVAVAAHPAATPCCVAGDAVQLVQVVLNLAGNALDAASRSAVGPRAVDVSVIAARGGGAFVAVVDSGPGIAPATLSRVFEPHFSTKDDGMGLGLDIASSIVRRHGGGLWVANNRDVGAHAVIALPLASPDGHAVREDHSSRSTS